VNEQSMLEHRGIMSLPDHFSWLFLVLVSSVANTNVWFKRKNQDNLVITPILSMDREGRETNKKT
jgi:hypothetical protein